MSQRRAMTMLFTCVCTVLAKLFVLNVMPSEKRIETRLTRTYNVDEPQFRRSTGVLLGPPIVEGNAQMFSSSPTGGSESMHLMAITAAQCSIRLSSAYFVPASWRWMRWWPPPSAA